MKYDRKYKCLIVEDEPIAAEILENFVLQNKNLNLVAKCSDAVYASSLLAMHDIDLMFLDLHLPVIKGFDFLKKLKNPPFVIVTTAYHEYALEGFDLNVIDYLLKPIPYSRFLTALGKFEHLIQAEEALVEIADREHIFLTIGRKQIKIILQEILYIESFREYIKIHTNTEILTAKMPISKIEQLLNVKNFQRIHKSFIISKDKIESYTANEIVIAGKKLPIGRTYKEFIAKN